MRRSRARSRSRRSSRRRSRRSKLMRALEPLRQRVGRRR